MDQGRNDEWYKRWIREQWIVDRLEQFEQM
jgi:hypothetical protein